MKKTKLLLIFFFLFINFCSPIDSNNFLTNCGEEPLEFVDLEIGNDPNFIFKNDPNFNQITLQDEEGNLATVNSYLECIHYVRGGWENQGVKKQENFKTSNLFISFFFVAPLALILFYFNFIHLKKNNINLLNLLNYFPFILFFIPLINIGLKILERGLYFPLSSRSEIIKYTSLSIGLFYFYFLGRLIRDFLQTRSFSLSISIYLSSFFIFELLSLPISKNISFSSLFLLVNSIWLILFLVKKSKIKIIFLWLLSYVILNIFNNKFITTFSENTNYKILNADVTKQWEPIVASIYNQNLYFALDINLIEGYGMLLSHIQAIIHKINFFNSPYFFSTLDVNLIFILSIFIFYDLKIAKINKVLITLSYFLILLDDGWLRFLLSNSLMLEGVVSFLFTSFIINIEILSDTKKSHFQKILFIIFASSLFFSKQFIEIIAILLLIIYLFRSKNLIRYFIWLFLIPISEIYKRIYLQNGNSIEYLDRGISEVFVDIIFLNNVVWNNANLIFKKLYEFKFIAFVLFAILIFKILNQIKDNHSNDKLFFYTLIINELLIILLYIFIWKDVEIDSSFRYLMNMSHLIFVSVITELDFYQKNKTSY